MPNNCLRDLASSVGGFHEDLFEGFRDLTLLSEDAGIDEYLPLFFFVHGIQTSLCPLPCEHVRIVRFGDGFGCLHGLTMV